MDTQRAGQPWLLLAGPQANQTAGCGASQSLGCVRRGRGRGTAPHPAGEPRFSEVPAGLPVCEAQLAGGCKMVSDPLPLRPGAARPSPAPRARSLQDPAVPTACPGTRAERGLCQGSLAPRLTSLEKIRQLRFPKINHLLKKAFFFNFTHQPFADRPVAAAAHRAGSQSVHSTGENRPGPGTATCSEPGRSAHYRRPGPSPKSGDEAAARVQ